MPYVANDSDRVKVVREARHEDGSLVNPPANVASLDEQRAKGKGKGKVRSAQEGVAASCDGPSLELRYARSCESNEHLRIGGPTGDADGRLDTTVYLWREDEDGTAHWRIQDPSAVEGHAHAWIETHMPSKVSTRNSRSAMQTMVTHLITRGSSHFMPKVNRKLNLVPLRGQYLSLTEQGEIRCLAPDPGYGVTYCVGATFEPRKARNGVYHPAPVRPDSLFGRYLATTFADDDVRNLAQEAFATVLINRCFEKSVWMFGEGENGKSLMLHLMAAVVGGRSVPMSFERLVKDQFGTSSLYGARIATVAEAPKLLTGQMQDTFKQVVSWDAMPLERKQRDAITFRPSAVILVACNELPKVGQHEHGFWRKVLTLPFTQRVSEANKIQDLHELIISSDSEMASVVDWLLIGAQRLIQRGGKFPKELPQAVIDLALRQRMESDPVSAFLDDSEAAAGPRVWSPRLGIYSAYRDYCTERGKSPLNETGFWTGVRRMFPGADLTGRKGPALNGKPRDRYVPLHVQGVQPLDPMRWPAAWHEPTTPRPVAPSQVSVPVGSNFDPLNDATAWDAAELDGVVTF